MSRGAERRTGRSAAPEPAAILAAAAAAGLLLAACGGPSPWVRFVGSPTPGDVTRAEYEVYCEECRATYTVPGEGPQNTGVETRWREVVPAEPGSSLSVSATVPEATERHRATIAIRLDGQVVDADTLWPGRDRRTIAVSHTVPGAPRSRAR